jgi:phosphatidylglycerophosphate synthase
MQKVNWKEDFWKGWQPNLITLGGMVLMALFIWLNAIGHFKMSLFVYVLAWSSDGLDGWWARKYQMETVFGQFFDQAIDKANTWANIVYFLIVLTNIIALNQFTIPIYVSVGSFVFIIGALLAGSRLWMILHPERVKQGKNLGAMPVGKIKTNVERSAFCLLILDQIYMYHVGIDDISIWTVYIGIFLLAVSIVFAGMSFLEQYRKIT